MQGPTPPASVGGAVATAAVLLSAAPFGAQMKKPGVVIVATGGTIAGTAASNTAAGYTSAVLAVEIFIAAVPQMQSFAERRGVQVSSQVLLKLSLMQSADPRMVQEFFNRS